MKTIKRQATCFTHERNTQVSQSSKIIESQQRLPTPEAVHPPDLGFADTNTLDSLTQQHSGSYAEKFQVPIYSPWNHQVESEEEKVLPTSVTGCQAIHETMMFAECKIDLLFLLSMEVHPRAHSPKTQRSDPQTNEFQPTGKHRGVSLVPVYSLLYHIPILRVHDWGHPFHQWH